MCRSLLSHFTSAGCRSVYSLYAGGAEGVSLKSFQRSDRGAARRGDHVLQYGRVFPCGPDHGGSTQDRLDREFPGLVTGKAVLNCSVGKGFFVESGTGTTGTTG